MMNGRDNNSLEQLWGESAIRIFISHTSEYKTVAQDIKLSLENYGIASFVAHEDIKPMQEWQSEIRNALFSMDMLIALLNQNFSESDWTDQEIGVAVGRKVPIVPIRLGKDPYGFIANLQAVNGVGKSAQVIAKEIFTLLFKGEILKDLPIDAYIMAIARTHSYDRANSLAKFLPEIEKLSPKQAESLVKEFNENSQVYRAFDFKASIVYHLKRMTGDDYKITNNELAKVKHIESFTKSD